MIQEQENKESVELEKGCDEKTCLLSHAESPHTQLNTNEDVQVDSGIAPLLNLLWENGLETQNSCEHNDGCGSKSGQHYVWIEFSDVEHLQEFINIVAQKYVTEKDRITTPEHSLFCRMQGEESDFGSESKILWKYKMHAPGDSGSSFELDEDKDEILPDRIIFGPLKFVFSASVRFPHCDYPLVLAAFKDIA